jgi:hypothetical protein
MDINKNQQAQDINSIEEINNNPEPVIEITPTPTPITIEEEIKDEIKLIEEMNTISTIEDMTDPNPIPPINPDENPTGTSNYVIERPKNTVRYIDGGFTF